MFTTRVSQGYTSMFTWPWDGKKNAGEVLCRVSSIGILHLVASKTIVVSGEENKLARIRPVRIFEKRNKYFVRSEGGTDCVLPSGSVRQLSHGGDVFNVCDVLTVQRFKIGTSIFDAVGCFGSSVSGADTIFYIVDAAKVGLPPDCGIVWLCDLLGQQDGLRTSPAYSAGLPTGGIGVEDGVDCVIDGDPGKFDEVRQAGEQLGALEDEIVELEKGVKYPKSQQYLFETEEEADEAEERKRLADVERLAEVRVLAEEVYALIVDKVKPHEEFILTGVDFTQDSNVFNEQRKERARAELLELEVMERERKERDARHKRMGVTVEGGVTKIQSITHVPYLNEVEKKRSRRRFERG